MAGEPEVMADKPAEPAPVEMSVDQLMQMQTRQRKEAPREETEGRSPEVGLEVLGPEEETWTTSIGEITFAPMRMKQIKKFLVVADKLLPALTEQLKETNGELNMKQLFSADQEAFTKALAIATNTDPEKLDEMFPDEFIRVATKAIVVNFDFFVRTLPGAYGGARLSILNALVRWVAGAAPSKS